MLKLTIFSLIIAIMSTTIFGIGCKNASTQYEQDIHSHWSLADKSSTLEAKSAHIKNYVLALENANLNGVHDTVWYPTPDNSFDTNLEALKTFQKRLEEIQGMKIDSFEYQTAIQQITAQEQGDAADMTRVFSGCWLKINHPWLYGVLGSLFIGLISVSWIVCLIASMAWVSDPGNYL